MTITPKEASVAKGKTLQFAWNVNVNPNDEENKEISLKLIGSSLSSLSNGGLLSVNSGETAKTIKVAVFSEVDKNKSDTATIHITDYTINSVQIDNKTVGLDKFSDIYNKHAFAAVVNVAENPVGVDTAHGVTWKIIKPADCKSAINAGSGSFLLDENEDADSIIIVATSKVDQLKADTAVIINSKIKSLSMEASTDVVLSFGQEIDFSVVVDFTGRYTGAVEWEILDNESSGTKFISKSNTEAKLTVSAGEMAYIIRVVVKSNEDKSKSDTIAIKIPDNKPVVEITSVEISPKSAIVAKNETLDFSVVLSGKNIYEADGDDDVEWTVMNAVENATTFENKTKTNAKLVIAANETAGEILVEVKSKKNEERADTAIIKIKAVKSVNVTSDSAKVERGKTLQFRADVVVINGAAQTVTWSKIGGVSATSINAASGLLTVAASETATSIKVVATSTFDNSVKDTMLISITMPSITSISITPKTQTVVKGGSTVTFNKSVLPATAKQEVVWSILGATASVINNGGVLRVLANETASVIRVVVSATDGSEKADTAVVTVNSPSVAISNLAKGRSDFGILFKRSSIVSENAEFEVLTPQPSEVSVVIYDNQGNVLFSKKDRTQKDEGANSMTVEWNLTNRSGRNVAGGTYIIQATAKSASQIYQYFAPIGVRR